MQDTELQMDIFFSYSCVLLQNCALAVVGYLCCRAVKNEPICTVISEILLQTLHHYCGCTLPRPPIQIC